MLGLYLMVSQEALEGVLVYSPIKVNKAEPSDCKTYNYVLITFKQNQ